MSLTAKATGNGDFEMTPQGTYVARCYKIVDMGTQTNETQFGTKEQHKVMISWELFDEDEQGKPIVMADGRPYSVTQFYNVSLHEKSKLRADLEAWRGKSFTEDELNGFDLATVLGAYCQIQVIHDTTGKYANVNAIMAFKGTKPEAINPNVVFDIDDPDMKVFDAMSDNMKAKIQAAPEWSKGTSAAPATPSKQVDDVVIEDIGDQPINLDDIPF